MAPAGAVAQFRAPWHHPELEAAVYAAMNVIRPVLDARDAEITRLHETLGRDRPPARPRPAAP
jgi:hypothetical protein